MAEVIDAAAIEATVREQFDALTRTLPIDALEGHGLDATIDATALTAALGEQISASVGGARGRTETITLDEFEGEQLDEMVDGLLSLNVGEGSEGELRMLDILGEGGMGVVHRARQRSLQRDVAIKALRRNDRGMASKLLHEAQLTGQLEHPNIVPVHMLGRDAETNSPLLVMRRIQGTSWLTLLQDPEHETWREAERSPGAQLERHLLILIQVCHAIEYAHDRGIVHRDIKPENVMLGRFGEVYAVDWGIAASLDELAKKPGALLGTPAYMPPEMAVGDTPQIGPRSDIYLLGASLHEVLVGAPPHQGRSLRETLLIAYSTDRLSLEAARQPVHAELEAILHRATARAPEDRYESVQALREALEAYLRHRSAITLTEQSRVQLQGLRVSVERYNARVAEDISQASFEQERELHERFNRCHFGFQMALRDWPESPEANRGAQSAVELMVEHALSHQRGALAASLLPLLPEGRDELAGRVEALLEAQRHEHDASTQLRALRRETDLSVAAGTRHKMVIAFIGFGTLISAIAIGSDPGQTRVEYSELFTFIIALTGVYVVALWFLRHKLLTNRINRVMLLGVVGVFMMIFAHRIVGWVLGIDSHHVLLVDQLIEAMAMAIGALAVIPRLWLTVAILLAGVAVGAAWPTWIPEVFSLTHVLIPIPVFWALRMNRRPIKGPDAG